MWAYAQCLTLKLRSWKKAAERYCEYPITFIYSMLTGAKTANFLPI